VLQNTHRTGNGKQEFDPQQWLSEDLKTVKLNTENNFGFGAGPRACVGQNLAMVELTTAVAIIAREVQAFDMSDEEKALDYVLAHPTGMPTRLIPRYR
jgi:cytochrome P450